MDKTLHDRLTRWRRHLHANPELTLHERDTAAFVQNRLTELNIPFTPGIGGHGVVATLTRGQSNRSVGLRADMDALPIHETSGVPHTSTNQGVMHACGHDGHTTSLLGAAALLADDANWTGTVQLVFWSTAPAPSSGSATARPTAAANYTTPTTTSTTRSCPPPPASSLPSPSELCNRQPGRRLPNHPLDPK